MKLRGRSAEIDAFLQIQSGGSPLGMGNTNELSNRLGTLIQLIYIKILVRQLQSPVLHGKFKIKRGAKTMKYEYH